MAYCYVTPDKATLFIDTARVSAEAAAELKENGVELAEYDDVLTFLAAQAEEQTVLADPVSVNYAVYQTLQALSLIHIYCTLLNGRTYQN